MTAEEAALVLGGRRLEAITEEHRDLATRARSRVQAKPPCLDQSGVLEDVPAELREHIDALRENESSSAMFSDGWRVVLADLRRVFFFSSRRRHTRLQGEWSSDVCSSD